METNLPTPFSARVYVYVNWLEGTSWSNSVAISFPVMIFSNYHSQLSREKSWSFIMVNVPILNLTIWPSHIYIYAYIHIYIGKMGKWENGDFIRISCGYKGKRWFHENIMIQYIQDLHGDYKGISWRFNYQL